MPSEAGRGKDWLGTAVKGWFLLCAMVLILDCGCLQAHAQRASEGPGNAGIDESFVVGRVKSVEGGAVDQELLKRTGIVSRRQSVVVEVLEGTLKGLSIEVSNEITDNPAYNVKVAPGQEVILSVTTENGARPQVNIADYRRAPVLFWLGAAFMVAFLVFGGKQGVKSLVGLFVCVLLISWVLLPLSLKGFDPLSTAVVICLLATAITMISVAGLSRKALAATLGTVGGIVIAGVAAQMVIASASLTGLSSEEAQILRGSVLNQPAEFYSGLLAAGMLIGALGVIMDVGVSIASAVWEVSRADKTLSVKGLYGSGMNVGRDIMGTMTSTLVFAYAGGALPLLLLAAQMPSIKLINLDLFATEIAAALTGSLGLVCTIPLTALAAAKLMSGAHDPFSGAGP